MLTITNHEIFSLKSPDLLVFLAVALCLPSLWPHCSTVQLQLLLLVIPPLLLAVSAAVGLAPPNHRSTTSQQGALTPYTIRITEPR